MNKYRRHHIFATSSGLSLVELLVAMAVTMVLVSVAAYAYLGSKSAYRTTDDQTQIYEDGRYALELLGREIRLAGFLNGVTGDGDVKWFDVFVLQGINPALTSSLAILGCEGGYNSGSCPVTATSSAPDAFAVRYFVDTPDIGNGVGVDCQGIPATATQKYTRSGTISVYEVVNWYYIGSTSYQLDGVTKTRSQLYCLGSASASPQPVLEGVVDMQLVYGLAPAGEQSVNQLLDAAAVSATNAWDRVVSVKICLLMETRHAGNSIATSSYKDCNGAMQTATNGVIRRAFSATYNLRNRVSQ